MQTPTTAQLRTAIAVLKKLGERLDKHATHSLMQLPDTRLGDDYAARIEWQTIEQIARLKTVMAQLESAMRWVCPRFCRRGKQAMNQARRKTKSGLNRRTFIRGTAATIAGFTIVPRHVLGGVGFVPPSEKVNIAIVRCGGPGRPNVRALFQEFAAQ